MARGKSRTQATATIDVNSDDVQTVKVVSAEHLTKLNWWGKLTGEEQAIVMREAEGLVQEQFINGRSRLAMGKHLEAVRTKLEPHGLFGRFLKFFGYKRTIAYRRINEYKNSMANLPETVVNAAMARNINILGESEDRPLGSYTEAVKALPPPERPNPEQASNYLDQLEELKKKMRSDEPSFNLNISSDPRVITKAIFKFVDNQLRRIDNQKLRTQVLNTVVGMLLRRQELPTTSFTPKPIPEDFLIGRGRPKATEAVAA